MRAVAVAGDGSTVEAVRAANEQPAMAGRALAAEVSTRERYVYEPKGGCGSRSSTTAASARS